MCSCGGLLTAWCYECGDEVCPHCGCLTDHEAEALAANVIEAAWPIVAAGLAAVERERDSLADLADELQEQDERNLAEMSALANQRDAAVAENARLLARIAAVEALHRGGDQGGSIRARAGVALAGHRRRRAGACSPLGVQDDPRCVGGFPYPNHRGAVVSGSACAFGCGDEAGVHPDGERLSGFVGGGLHGVPLGFGGADAQDLAARVVERGSAASFGLVHGTENIRPRKVLTGAGFMGHNKGMTTTKNLTAAAKRDLAKLQAGERVDLRYGPFEQLRDAGYIEGTQDNYRLVEKDAR